MTTHNRFHIPALCLLHSAFCLSVAAQPTSLTYQGSLSDNGSSASGLYDLRFSLHDDASGGSQQGESLTNAAVAVSNGLFTVTLDFGPGVFDGTDRWLEVGATTNGGGVFSTLSPRQPITATPYALRALNISSNALASYAGAVSFTNPSNTFAGDGSALSNINVSTVGGLSASNFWQLGGNTGTTPGVDFLGTTDNQPLELKVNGQRALRIEATATAPNIIGGIDGNSVASGTEGATIGGGGSAAFPNLIFTNTDYSTIGGGVGNAIATGASYATVAGGSGNIVGLSAFYGTIGGGLLNNARSSYGAIGGGYSLKIHTNSPYGTLGGGDGNVIQINSTHSTVGGGYQNTIGVDADHSTISGGRNNSVAGDRATVGGGYDNSAQGSDSAIGGGQGNIASSSWTTVGGGQANLADGVHSSVGGGRGNEALGTYSAVAGGNGNTAEGYRSTIGGGDNNAATVSGATVGGGLNNMASGFYTSVAGGQANAASQSHGTVAGGQRNEALGNFATIAGCQDNTASGGSSIIGGGALNFAQGSYSSVLGGQTNRATGYWSVVAGGENNAASGTYAAILGGRFNSASDFYSIAMGYSNSASGQASVAMGSSTEASGYASTAMGQNTVASGNYSVAMGEDSEASAAYSFAAGNGARALHTGTFVWADSQLPDFVSATNNQFVVRAANGIGLGGNDTSFGIVQVQQPSDDIDHGLAVANVAGSRTLRMWVDNQDKSRIDSGPTGGAPLIINLGGGNVGIGNYIPGSALHVDGTVTATAFNPVSDRDAKENFEAIDPAAVLAKVAALPLSQWNFKTDATTAHIGPMAQDFHAAFGLGTDERHIATVDADGVALAAIQGLNQKLTQKEAEIAELKQSVRQLKELVGALNHKLNGDVK